MRDIKYLVVGVLFLFCFTITVEAACDIENLNNIANEMKVELYVPDVDETLENDVDYYLRVSPIESNFYLNVYENGSETPTKIEYDVEEFVYIIKSPIHTDEKIYKIDIVSNIEQACYEEVLRTIDYTVPPYNMYSRRDICRLNPSLDVCQRYKDTSDISEEEFNNIIEERINENEEKYERLNETLFHKIMRYILYALIPIALVAIFYIIQIKIIKKKKEAK